jgi:hypothetical protein
MIVEVMPKERYFCGSCDVEFRGDEINRNWKCLHCERYLHIYGEETISGIKRILIRKEAREVKKGDLLHLPSGLLDDCYLVLGVNSLGKKLGIGLQGYGAFKASPGEFLNCRIGGSWEES